jgi:hypothetical protein
MDIFNVFNLQAVTAKSERYTASDVQPVLDGNLDSLKHTDGSAFDPKTEVDPNFGRAIGYQAPRSFRFGLRGEF